MSPSCLFATVFLAAVFPLPGQATRDTVIKAPQRPGLDTAIEQRLTRADKARETNDTAREISELSPAFERAIEIQSAGYIKYVLNSLTRAYIDVDQKRKVVDPLKRGVEAIRRIAGPESIETAEFEVAAAMVCFELDEHAEALRLMADAERIVRKAAGPDSALLRKVLEARAMLTAMTGDENRGAGIMQEAEAIEQRRRPVDEFGYVPNASIDSLLAGANAAAGRKDYVTADRLTGEATTAAERLNIQNPFRARAWFAAAGVYGSAPATVRGALREKYLRRALDLSETAMGGQRIPDVMRLSLPLVHLQVFGNAARTLGQYLSVGRSADNLALLKRCAAVHEQALGPDHPMVGVWFGELSDFYLSQRSFATAIDYQQRKLKTYEQSFGADDIQVEEPLTKMAEIYRTKGDQATAKRFYGRSSSVRNRALTARTEEDAVRSQVKQLRLFFNFAGADEQIELFRNRHPGLRLE